MAESQISFTLISAEDPAATHFYSRESAPKLKITSGIHPKLDFKGKLQRVGC